MILVKVMGILELIKFTDVWYNSSIMIIIRRVIRIGIKVFLIRIRFVYCTALQRSRQYYQDCIDRTTAQALYVTNHPFWFTYLLHLQFLAGQRQLIKKWLREPARRDRTAVPGASWGRGRVSAAELSAQRGTSPLPHFYSASVLA